MWFVHFSARTTGRNGPLLRVGTLFKRANQIGTMMLDGARKGSHKILRSLTRQPNNLTAASSLLVLARQQILVLAQSGPSHSVHVYSTGTSRNNVKMARRPEIPNPNRNMAAVTQFPLFHHWATISVLDKKSYNTAYLRASLWASPELQF